MAMSADPLQIAVRGHGDEQFVLDTLVDLEFRVGLEELPHRCLGVVTLAPGSRRISCHQLDLVSFALQLDDDRIPIFGQLIIGIQELDSIDCSIWSDIDVHFITDLDRRDLSDLLVNSQVRDIVLRIIA